jgi:hypothetical protein
MRARAAVLSLLLVAAARGRHALGDEPAPAPAPVPSPAPSPSDGSEVLAVGLVTGDAVNLRVGPRIDDAPVGQVPQGTVVLVVERAGDWLGVRLPTGFPAAVAAALTEPAGENLVRVVADQVNLRVRPPAGERAYPAFRDHPRNGSVLSVLEREGDWIWVEAPEEIRAYVHARFVKELGTVAAEVERVEAARRERVRRNEALLAARAKAREAKDEAALREEVSAVGMALVRLRAEGGYETSPVAALSDRLASKVEAHAGALDRTKALAKALLEDLEREIELRIAFHDELLSSARTGTPKPRGPKPPAPTSDAVEATGLVRWEAAPGWEGGGAFVLWAADKPSHALRYAKGDLKAYETGKPVKVRGKATGARLLGLPTIEVESVAPVP